MGGINNTISSTVSKTNLYVQPFSTVQSGTGPSHTDATTTVTATFTGNANLSNLTGGVYDMWFEISIMT